MGDEEKKEQIGDYELLGLIGDGAQGRVYKARCLSDSHPRLRRDEVVALKVVRITGEDEKLRLKFQEQAEILRRLSHTNIVSYKDCFSWHAGEWDEAQCLVMEFLEGETLHERLKNTSAGLSWPQVETIFEQCLAGLIHARERGITHRDIKPSNIFLNKDGQTKLIDFDIARRDDSGQMSTAGCKGTFDYMAPDFITVEGFRGDECSDVFSLGVCFYQALTGSLPYEPLGDNAHISYLNRWRNNAAPAPTFRPGVFRVLSNAKGVVLRCLAVQRDQRYASFAAFLEDFRKIHYRRVRHKNKDEYELLAVLGRGGFGEVFKARRVSDGLLVAVKYLFAEKQSDRFIKEAKILQQYSHPNLVKYIDFMMIEGTGGDKQFFLIMEFLEGMPGWTLRPRIKNEGSLEPAEIVPLFCSYLSAIQFLHENARPIIHRDIKPGNLYAPVGQPEKGKVFDLGVARDVTGTVTVGGVPGTLDYMPPEFADTGGDRGSPQSDLYALGLCLYEALVGKPVFERLPSDLNAAWIAFQDRLRKPPPFDFENAVFERYPRFKAIILRALATLPADRYPSAVAMRTEIEQALKPIEATPAAQGVFDDDESALTMATFSSPGPSAAGSDATVGTRPLDMAAATMPAPIDLIAAGKSEAARRKKRRGLIRASAAAVGLLAIGYGGLWVGTRMNTPPASTAADTLAAPVTEPQPQQPAHSAEPTPEDPDAVKRAAQEQASRAVADTVAALPGSITEAENTQTLHNLAAAFAALESNSDARITPEQTAAVEQALTQTYLTFAGRLCREAQEAYDAGRMDDGLAKQNELTELAAAVPPRFGKSLLDTRVQETEAKRTDAQTRIAREAEQRRATEQAKLAQEEAQRLARAAAQKQIADLRAQIGKGSLAACADGIVRLSQISPDVLAQAAIKAEWDVTRDAFADLIGQTLLQKDPLTERAQRIKTADDVLAAPAANTVLGDRAAELKASASQQKRSYLLRLVNRSGGAVQVSSQDYLKEKVALADDETKEWLFPLAGEQATVSLLIEGDTRTRPRTEVVKMTASGASQQIIGALEKAEVAQPVKPPAPMPTPAPAPAPTPTLTPDPKPAPAGATEKAFLEISVSPRTARIHVDDQAVEMGRITVTANDNHKVTVELPGYKPIQQYYRVKPGETRKIDILLEKEAKKSFFPF